MNLEYSRNGKFTSEIRAFKGRVVEDGVRENVVYKGFYMEFGFCSK